MCERTEAIEDSHRTRDGGLFDPQESPEDDIDIYLRLLEYKTRRDRGLRAQDIDRT